MKRPSTTATKTSDSKVKAEPKTKAKPKTKKR